jgi:hypothetical protein
VDQRETEDFFKGAVGLTSLFAHLGVAPMPSGVCAKIMIVFLATPRGIWANPFLQFDSPVAPP